MMQRQAGPPQFDYQPGYRQGAPNGDYSNEPFDDFSFLLSPMSEGITGEILHVDCGYNIMGSPGRLLDELKK